MCLCVKKNDFNHITDSKEKEALKEALKAALKEAGAFIKKYKDSEHPLVPKVYEFIADDYFSKSNLNGAEREYKNALELAKKVGRDDEDIVRILKRLSEIYEKRKNYKEAINYMVQVLVYNGENKNLKKIESLKITPEIIKFYERLQYAMNEGNVNDLDFLISKDYINREGFINSFKKHAEKNIILADLLILDYNKTEGIVEVEATISIDGGEKDKLPNTLKKIGDKLVLFR